MFKADSPFVIFLNRLTDIVILNLFFILFSLPIFTIGASTTALYYVCVKMVKNEESYIWKDFVKSFKTNFRQATIIWVVNLIAITILATDYVILSGGSIENLSTAMLVVLVIFVLILLALMAYVYPMLSHFYNTIPVTFKNSLLLAIGKLPYTAAFILIMALPYALFLFTSIGVRGIPYMILAGFSLPVYISSHLWVKIFAKLDPEDGSGGVNGQETEESE